MIISGVGDCPLCRSSVTTTLGTKPFAWIPLLTTMPWIDGSLAAALAPGIWSGRIVTHPLRAGIVTVGSLSLFRSNARVGAPATVHDTADAPRP